MRRLALLVGGILLGGCASADTDDPAATGGTATVATIGVESTAAEQADEATEADDSDFPSVIDAVATPEGDNSWRFDVTISSPYDSPERYADAWRVLGPDDTEYGIRILTHDHASEQPFTRSQSGIAIPADVRTVTIQGRDLVNGWGGPTFDLTLPEATQ